MSQEAHHHLNAYNSSSLPTSTRQELVTIAEPPKKKRKASALDEEDAGWSLACPFCKKDPSKYEKCGRLKGFSNISRMKDHLYKTHQVPVICYRCHRAFPNETLRDEHLDVPDDERCVQTTSPPPEGLSSSATVQLKKRTKLHGPQSVKVQWEHIFRVIFPNHRGPLPSPYVEGNITALENYEKDPSVQKRIRDELLKQCSAAGMLLSAAQLHLITGTYSKLLIKGFRASCDGRDAGTGVLAGPVATPNNSFGHLQTSGMNFLAPVDLTCDTPASTMDGITSGSYPIDTSYVNPNPNNMVRMAGFGAAAANMYGHAAGQSTSRPPPLSYNYSLNSPGANLESSLDSSEVEWNFDPQSLSGVPGYTTQFPPRFDDTSRQNHP